MPVCYISMRCSFVKRIAGDSAITLQAMYCVGMTVEPWERKRVGATQFTAPATAPA
jgi:hypothetical protein